MDDWGVDTYVELRSETECVSLRYPLSVEGFVTIKSLVSLLDQGTPQGCSLKLSIQEYEEYIKGKVPVNWKDRRDIKRLETSRIVSKP